MKATEILTTYREKLDIIARELLDRETLEAEEFVALIEGEGLPPSSSDTSPPAATKTALESENKSESDWKKPPSLDLPPSPTPA